jgi:hypothetical protein
VPTHSSGKGRLKRRQWRGSHEKWSKGKKLSRVRILNFYFNLQRAAFGGIFMFKWGVL